ncbi:MAG TPA: VWA domain-containing protein [Vicinamibacterales bacterium]|nr:VWA domain-containing protein [Vicinamibacterales bacterium]
MSRASIPAAALLAAVSTAYAGLGAQTAPTAPPAASEEAAAPPAVDARLVRLDAIVTDKSGKPITNLKVSDFAIADNGLTQTIESAVLMSKRTAAPVGPVNVRAAATDAGGEGTAIESPAKLEERLAKEPGTRVFAIYLDEFHVSAGASTARVRAALTTFIDEELRSSDLAVVMKPLDHLDSIRFTRDRDALRASVASFDGRRGDYAARTAFEEHYIGKVPGAVRAARAQIVSSGLRALATRIGELDAGLSGIILVTEGFTTDGMQSRERRLPDLQTLVRATGRFRVVLYTVNPGDMATAASDADAGLAADDAAEATLEKLARQTGGAAVTRGSDMVAGLRRVSNDLDTYYVLTYRSTTPSDGRFHDLKVATTRRDAQVRARAGYWAPLPAEMRAARVPPAPFSFPRPMRRSALIQSWFGTTVEQDGRRRVIFTWTPAVAKTATAAAKPAARPEVVALKVTTPAGKVLFEGDVFPVMPGSGSARVESAVFDAPQGRLQFDLNILRGDGSKLDVGMEDFDLPELKKGPPIILQPQLFRAASAREFRELSSNANAAPLPGRDFRRTEHLLMRVPTFDAAGARVQVSAKLINRTGTVLAELAPTTDPPTHISQFELVLARFAPGEYALEVSAASDSGTSRQLIHFRITG